MASKKGKYAEGVRFLQDKHSHLLVDSVSEVVDEGTHVKIVFTDTAGAKGFVRLTQKQYDKSFASVKEEVKPEPKAETKLEVKSKEDDKSKSNGSTEPSSDVRSEPVSKSKD